MAPNTERGGLQWHQFMTNFHLFFVLQVNEMASTRRSWRNKPDVFCYICGEYTIAPNRKSVTSFITRAYRAYFCIKLTDQHKTWAPHMVCKECTETLRGLTNGKRCLNFGIPLVWREPTNHFTDCYFCCWCDWDQQKEPGQPQVSWSSISTERALLLSQNWATLTLIRTL